MAMTNTLFCPALLASVSVAKLRFAPNRGRFAPAIANVFGYFLLVVDKWTDICVHVSI
jgi:hypothetical protein